MTTSSGRLSFLAHCIYLYSMATFAYRRPVVTEMAQLQAFITYHIKTGVWMCAIMMIFIPCFVILFHKVSFDMPGVYMFQHL